MSGRICYFQLLLISNVISSHGLPDPGTRLTQKTQASIDGLHFFSIPFTRFYDLDVLSMTSQNDGKRKNEKYRVIYP
jgi:hypothetical protein